MSEALQEALEYEGKDAALSIEEMMAQMLGNVESAGEHVRSDLDEYTIRKMLLARSYMEKDIKKMEDMKKAIVSEWDSRIKKKKDDIANIESLVDTFIREDNKGKTLSLDVATASMRRVNAKFTIKDEEKVKDFLTRSHKLEDFLKEAPLDKTSVQNHMMDLFLQNIEPMIASEIEKEKNENPKGKITKKREKEISIEVMDRELPLANEKLPEGFELVMPKQTLSIRSNIK